MDAKRGSLVFVDELDHEPKMQAKLVGPRRQNLRNDYIRKKNIEKILS
jgi:hypothetical protein